MSLKTRLLVQSIGAFLALTLLLSGVFFLSIERIRGTVFRNSAALGDSAAEVSAYMLEVLHTEKINRAAIDTVLLLDERLGRIESHTRMVADIAGSFHDAGDIAETFGQIAVAGRNIAAVAIDRDAGLAWAMDAGMPYWTDVHADRPGSEPAISCIVPFFDRSAGQDVFMGVARSTVRLSDFSHIIDPVGIRRGGQFFILNRRGIMVYSSDGVETRLGEGGVEGQSFLEIDDPRLRSLGLSMTLGATGMTELEMGGIPFYVAYAPIRTLGWSLGVTVPAQEIYVPAMQIGGRIWEITEATRAAVDGYILVLAGIIAFLLVMILPAIAFFAVRFTRAITGPVLALSGGVREVAGGNLDREVIVKTGDELEQLAAAFNGMTGRLRAHIAETARATAERQRIDTELDVAMRIQASMLPTDFPPFRDRKNGFDLYAEVHPAKEVGGDFYDFFFIDDDRIAVLVADVSGKGIPAALFMATTKTLIKNRLQGMGRPDLALEEVNRELCDGNALHMFVTAWLCVLEISSGRLMYVNAGHNPPMLCRGRGGFEFLVSPPDLVLACMEDTVYSCHEMRMEKGDVLFLYTDGIVEEADGGGEFYGRERMKAFLDANALLPLREMLPGLRADVAAFANGAEQSDDITMLALRVAGCAPAADPPPLQLTLRADISDLGALVDFIGGELEAAGCPDRERVHVELAAEEVFVNIASYAYQSGETASGEVVVECRVRTASGRTEATVAFTDRGSPFNPLEHEEPDITLPLEDRELGGLGILIVKKVIDTIEYSRESGMNRLEFTKSWRKEEA